MNEEIKENGVAEDNGAYKFSWRKLCSWLSLVLVLSSPLIGIGLAIMCIVNASEDEREEVSMLCYIIFMVGIMILAIDFLPLLFG